MILGFVAPAPTGPGPRWTPQPALIEEILRGQGTFSQKLWFGFGIVVFLLGMSGLGLYGLCTNWLIKSKSEKKA